MILLKGDCLVEMDKIPDGSVDLILTDPPYGTTACKWDSVIPFDQMWEQLNRIIKPNGAIVLFGSEPFSSALRMSNIKNYKYDWIWEKNRPTGMFLAKKQPMEYHEIISVFNSKIYYPQMWEGKPSHSVGKGISKSSHYDLPILKDREDSKNKYPKSICVFDRPHPPVHPTQKPVALGQYLIRTYTNKGETILDFTAGSGSFGVAAIREGRKFIGIELDKDYYKIMKERVTKELQSSSDYGIL